MPDTIPNAEEFDRLMAEFRKIEALVAKHGVDIAALCGPSEVTRDIAKPPRSLFGVASEIDMAMHDLQGAADLINALSCSDADIKSRAMGPIWVAINAGITRLSKAYDNVVAASKAEVAS